MLEARVHVAHRLREGAALGAAETALLPHALDRLVYLSVGRSLAAGLHVDVFAALSAVVPPCPLLPP